MNKYVYPLSLLFSMLFLSSFVSGQAPDAFSDLTFGGTSIENLYAFIQTEDGGYLLAGTSNSGISGDKTADKRGSFDYWIVKLDSNRNKQWDKTFGGMGSDVLYSVIPTREGGYLLIGYSSSAKGGDKTQDNKGEEDYWIVKIDQAGNKLWDKTYGGSGGDIAKSGVETSDGHYILAGNSYSSVGGDKTKASQGNEDYWLLKIDENGNKLWDKTIGGNDADLLTNIIITDDNGFMLSGTSYSGIGADKSQQSQGSWDFWIVKLNEQGDKQWDKTFGGTQSEFPASLIQTTEGTYVIAGISDSDSGGDKTEASWGGWDYWILKTDKNGNKLWDKRYGGQGNDDFGSLIETLDGNYLLTGTSDSEASGDKTQDSEGKEDFWIIKTDKDGNKVWDKTFGGSQSDVLKSVIQSSEGTYQLAGYSESPVSGNKTESGNGSFDFWLLSTTSDGTFTPLLQVNFGDKHSNIPSGWVRDYGLPFGKKTSGQDAEMYTYGWKNAANGTPIDLTVGGPFPGNGRWRPVPSDILLATLMHMQGNDVKNFRGTPVESYWELEVENGNYEVSTSVGDGIDYTRNDPENHTIRVEGKAAITGFIPEGKNGALSRFKQATIQVYVSDGLLTIDAQGGKNTKINYAIIRRFSTSTATNQKAAATLYTYSPSLQAFPNPFTDKILIRLMPQHRGKIIVTLHDGLGIVYHKWEKNTENDLITLNVSNLNLKAGVYLVSITGKNGVRQSVKIIKQ